MDAVYIAKIMNGRSCAELESVINEAGLYAGFKRADSITMDHFVEACARTIFDVPAESFDGENWFTNLCDRNNTKSQIVYHETGHAVASEILCPGSVTLVSHIVVEVSLVALLRIIVRMKVIH
jgi:cell division protease FtsH